MGKAKKACIIGAGIGGITTSIYLAQKGYQVSVFEKNASPGGRCGQIIRDGHRFDLGATILLMPGIYQKVFQTLGIDFSDFFTRLPLDVLYRIHFDDGKKLDFTTDQSTFKEQLETIEKGSYHKAVLYIRKGYVSFGLAMEKLLGRNFTHIFQFINLKNAWLLVRLKTYLKHISWVKRFFKNEHLRTAFTFQNIYVGQNPLTAPALFSMIPAAELTEGSFFPQGGMYTVAEKLIEEAKKLGVKFTCNQPVTKIHVAGNTATAIETADGEIHEGSVIVANADLPYVYRELLPDRKRSQRIDRMKYSCSSIVIHWGMDKAYKELSHHNVFLSARYRSNLKTIFREHALSDQPSFYVHAPAATDPSAAPAGQDSLSVIIPAGHLGSRGERDWNEMKNAARASVINRLKELGMDDIEEHIKFEICYLPQTWKTLFNLTRGATFGSLAHHILQMGYFRPHNRHPRYRNLYFTGGSTHPGNGVPLVLLSAMLTSERIIKECDHGI